MHRKQTTLTLCLLLILALLLAGCSRSESPAAQSDSPVSAESGPESIRIGGQEFSLEATEITAVLAPGETELLDRLPRLHYADLSGSEAIDEIAAWASAHPNVSVRYTIPLPNGALLPSDTVSYDLYHIQPYACGIPSVVLPIFWLSKHVSLTPFAKRLFGPDSYVE